MSKMSNTYLGLDIGAGSAKLAVVKGGVVHRLAEAALPDNLFKDGRIVSPDAMAEELRSALRREHIAVRSCALSLPPETAYVRRVTVPYMTVEQLNVNLPYEFHDYIQKDKNLYFYDYAVVKTEKGDEGEPKSIELMAAATPKEVIADCRTMLRKAGLHLSMAVPEVLTYRNLIRNYEASHDDHPEEYCIVDMGHSGIRVHMYRGDAYELSHNIEYGGASIDALIADSESVDPHVAADYKLTGYEGAQKIPACRELYSRMAVEILRAVNYYGFNTPDADLRDIFFCGGLAKVKALMETIRTTLDQINIHFIDELMPLREKTETTVLCPAAVGVAMELSGR
jgi:type IV pilus assembly protein PilM